jgi:excisionase family DNA binding protein
LVDVVRDLAHVLPDGQIARVLNRLGYRTGAGNTWTQSRVASARHSHQIPPFDPQAARSTLTLAEAAGALGVSTITVRRMIERHLLRATQSVMHAPWVIRREDLHRGSVQPSNRSSADGRFREQGMRIS